MKGAVYVHWVTPAGVVACSDTAGSRVRKQQAPLDGEKEQDGVDQKSLTHRQQGQSASWGVANTGYWLTGVTGKV